MRNRGYWGCPERQAALAALSAMGLSAKEIADEIGATRDAVKNALNRYGLYATRRGSRKPVTLAERAWQ
jgi:transposase